MSGSSGEARLHGIDGLRGSTMLLVAMTHVACSHVVGIPDWAIIDEPSLSLSLIGYLATLFSMNVFLFLGGYFGKAQYDRKGARAFVTDRAIRIALPLVVFWPILRLALEGLYVWGDHVVAAAGKPPAAHPVNDILSYLMHLWFLYFLCLCYLAALAVRALPAVPLGWLDRIVAFAFRYRVATLLWALPLSVTIILTHGWSPWLGIPTPAFPPLPNLYAIIGYGAAFAAGWIVRRQPWILDLIARDWLVNMVLAVVATLFNIYLLATVTPTPTGLTLVERVMFGPAYAFAAWALTLGLIGTVLRWVRRPSRVGSYIGQASYWVYLVHIPVVVTIQILLYPLDWSPWTKFTVNSAVSLSLLFMSYNLLVRDRWLGVWLNGKKAGPQARPLAETASRV